MSLYLAVDLGTTGCRSIIFDENLKEIASSYEEYGLITPKEGYVLQDAEDWWELTLKTAEEAIKKSGINPKEIDSISVSSQGITIVPVDENFIPLSLALSWLDTRAEAETERIKKDFGETEIFRLTGKPVVSAYTLPKLIWLKENEPEIFSKAYKFLMPLDFLLARFSGEAVTDYSMASGTLMFDLKNLCWADDILSHYGIPKEKLPSLWESGSRLGVVLPEIRERLNLKDSCIVSVGAQDQKCAALGAGLKKGVMTISLGTAGAITKLWETAETEKNCGAGWCGYVDKKSFVTEGVIGTAGTCLRWVRDTYFKNDSYITIDKEAEEAKNRGSNLLFYPFFAGECSPNYYPESTGVFYGMSLSTTRGDFALACMEGVAFQIREILEAMEAYGNVEKIILFGGGAKGSFWPQIIANAVGLTIETTETAEAAGAGAAILAARATDKKLTPLKISKTYTPLEKEEYNKKYQKYLKIEKNLWAKED